MTVARAVGDEKKCGRCREIKTVSDYNLDKNRIDGYANRCRKCESEVRAEYRERHHERELQRNRSYYLENKESFMRYQKARRKDKREIYNAYKQRRRARKRMLPDTLKSYEVVEILDKFNHKCALSDSADVELDHFISLSTNRGGTIASNIIPLSRKLNASKGGRNPFTWFVASNQRLSIPLERFERLIEYLANENSMTVEEYEKHVYECYEGLAV